MKLEEYGHLELHIHGDVVVHEEISHRNIWELKAAGNNIHLMLFSFTVFRNDTFQHFIYTRRNDRGSPKIVLEALK